MLIRYHVSWIYFVKYENSFSYSLKLSLLEFYVVYVLISFRFSLRLRFVHVNIPRLANCYKYGVPPCSRDEKTYLKKGWSRWRFIHLCRRCDVDVGDQNQETWWHRNPMTYFTCRPKLSRPRVFPPCGCVLSRAGDWGGSACCYTLNPRLFYQGW